jgi:hypothetical protein
MWFCEKKLLNIIFYDNLLKNIIICEKSLFLCFFYENNIFLWNKWWFIIFYVNLYKFIEKQVKDDFFNKNMIFFVFLVKKDLFYEI